MSNEFVGQPSTRPHAVSRPTSPGCPWARCESAICSSDHSSGQRTSVGLGRPTRQSECPQSTVIMQIFGWDLSEAAIWHPGDAHKVAAHSLAFAQADSAQLLLQQHPVRPLVASVAEQLL